MIQQNSGGGLDNTPSNNGLLTPADASRAIYALSAAVDRLFEHAANTLHLEGLLSFLEALVFASKSQLYGSVDKGTNSPGGVSGNNQSPSYSTTLHLYRLADVILRSARNTSRPLLHLMRAWAVISPHFVEVSGSDKTFCLRRTFLRGSGPHNVTQSLLFNSFFKMSTYPMLPFHRSVNGTCIAFLPNTEC